MNVFHTEPGQGGRGGNNRGSHADTKGGWDGETPQIELCFPGSEGRLVTLSLSSQTGPLCLGVIGYTHDDKVGRSDPAIVKTCHRSS